MVGDYHKRYQDFSTSLDCGGVSLILKIMLVLRGTSAFGTKTLGDRYSKVGKEFVEKSFGIHKLF